LRGHQSSIRKTQCYFLLVRKVDFPQTSEEFTRNHPVGSRSPSSQDLWSRNCLRRRDSTNLRISARLSSVKSIGTYIVIHDGCKTKITHQSSQGNPEHDVAPENDRIPCSALKLLLAILPYLPIVNPRLFVSAAGKSLNGNWRLLNILSN
jgi:hypothetical protein